jgi:hypothetical protein
MKRTPLMIFSEGWRTLLGIPVNVLRDLGVMGARRALRITRSIPFRFISRLLAVVAFFGAIVGLIADWPTVVAILDWLRARLP